MEESPAAARWRVPPAQTALKCAAAAVFAVLAALSDEPGGLLLAAVATLGSGGLALRDLLAPVRVAADPGAVTVVTGFAGHRTLTWPEVLDVGTDERRRFLSTTRLLEIRTDDDLYLFSAFDLGADVREVADELDRLRAGGPRS
ncbi:PH domain-containing protein [Actinomadura macrotermitis]|uniref:Low molecular weight protein antigen 6 PH domain-containing protein n=1 Tax=Actinomadura macrotermitis TaxID=2585200 RepID=A0A7K0C7H5_9ACTN|nr:PH domain-containing protein [Actinomadura macrotermitis]MQY09368.1 hypothetical protein [Actinomadura macrotermitis]